MGAKGQGNHKKAGANYYPAVEYFLVPFHLCGGVRASLLICFANRLLQFSPFSRWAVVNSGSGAFLRHKGEGISGVNQSGHLALRVIQVTKMHRLSFAANNAEGLKPLVDAVVAQVALFCQSCLRATADGDDYIFNGQKHFITSQPIKPDYLYTEARTLEITPKHRGLTLFLIPADTTGITYNPLPVMSDHLTLEVFFDNVRVPRDYMLGELNRGFYHAMTTQEFERTRTDWPAGYMRDLEEFIQFCQETKRNGKPLIEDQQIRDTLAQIAVNIEVFRLACWRTTWRFSQRETLDLDYDLGGLLYKILAAPIYEAMMNILGLYGQLQVGSKWVQLAGSIEHKWRFSRSIHGAGTIEALKIVLASRGLGLPRRR